jgi:anti-sigma-K factor RskA
VTDESTEIFDDLYLGLRAGGAMRKQRRGEPLTAEEEQALGHWQRLSTWRKAIAVGAFAVGTFGLGFTLGGLVFGRWRRAKA